MVRDGQGPRVIGLSLMLMLGLGGCAIHPYPHAAGVQAHVSPATVQAHPKSTRGARVRWGGLILSDHVGATRSTLTILAYPLDSAGRPRTGGLSEGRFQAVAPTYLDPIVFAPGHVLTIVGTVSGTRTGLIGQARYLYPRIHILKTHFWPQYRARRRSPWRFGLGIGIRL